MKPGDKVRCVDVRGVEFDLIKDEIYTVANVGTNTYLIQEKIRSYLQKRFELVTLETIEDLDKQIEVLTSRKAALQLEKEITERAEAVKAMLTMALDIKAPIKDEAFRVGNWYMRIQVSPLCSNENK